MNYIKAKNPAELLQAWFADQQAVYLDKHDRLVTCDANHIYAGYGAFKIATKNHALKAFIVLNREVLALGEGIWFVIGTLQGQHEAASVDCNLEKMSTCDLATLRTEILKTECRLVEKKLKQFSRARTYLPGLGSLEYVREKLKKWDLELPTKYTDQLTAIVAKNRLLGKTK
jgi:hypothetical protein